MVIFISCAAVVEVSGGGGVSYREREVKAGITLQEHEYEINSAVTITPTKINSAVATSSPAQYDGCVCAEFKQVAGDVVGARGCVAWIYS